MCVPAVCNTSPHCIFLITTYDREAEHTDAVPSRAGPPQEHLCEVMYTRTSHIDLKRVTFAGRRYNGVL